MVFGALRLYYILIMDFTDVTASQLPVIIMGTIEPGVAIMVSCSPLLKPVFDAIFRYVLSCLSITTRSRVNSATDLGGDTTLITFGGGNIKGKHITPFQVGKNSKTQGVMTYVDGNNDLELDGLRDRMQEVLVTAKLSRNSVDGNNFGHCEENGSEDGILVTNKAKTPSGS